MSTLIEDSREAAVGIAGRVEANYTPPGEVGELEPAGPGAFTFLVHAPGLFDDGEFVGEKRVRQVMANQLKKWEGLTADIFGASEGEETFSIRVATEEVPLEIGDIVTIGRKSWVGWYAKVTSVDGNKVGLSGWKNKQRYEGSTYLNRIASVLTDEEIDELEGGVPV